MILTSLNMVPMHQTRRFYTAFLLASAIFLWKNVFSQTDAVIYPSMSWQGEPLSVHVGQRYSDINFEGNNKSIDIINPCGIYLFREPNYQGPYIFINSDLQFIEKGDGQNQYDKVRSIIVTKANEIPQPRRWVPIDGRDVPTGHNPGSCSQDTPFSTGNLLVVRRAYIWENTDAWECPHGPWAEVRVKALAGPVTTDFKLAGPIPYAHDKCLLGCWPSDEWADNWDGVVYSNFGFFDWDATELNEVTVVVNEGTADFMVFTVSRFENEIIYFQNNYGFIEVQNVFLSAPEPRICTGDIYVSSYAISDAYPEIHYPLTGIAQFPFDNLLEAYQQTPQNGALVLYPGEYHGSYKFDKPMMLKSCQGTATIGKGIYHAPQIRSPVAPNCKCGPF